MKFEKSELFGKGEVRRENEKRSAENLDRDWFYKRVEYFFRELIKERKIEIDERELDTIDFMFSAHKKGLVTVYGNIIRLKSDGGYETSHMDSELPYRDLTVEETDEFLHRYKFDILVPLWIEAFEIAKSEQNSQLDPESTPPSLPPDAKYLEKTETLSPTMGTAKYADRMTDGRHNHYPNIGASGLFTKYGIVNGTLIWCDGESAIFDTPQGKLRIRFADIVSPSGRTYGEISNTEAYGKVRRESTALKYRSR